ncbi:hypothetical protein [Streptomyces sp. NPDC005476]|uniref:hypothetical protein n=1 Tax=Streptomyces sp. NPDC005476 TaxID=3156882 RepID=UPI00345271F0
MNDPAGRQRHEIDVVALNEDERRLDPSPVICAIGEAKASGRARPLADLDRLDRIRGLLIARGVRTASAKLPLFGRIGFDINPTQAAAERNDVELVDLHRIRHGECRFACVQPFAGSCPRERSVKALRHPGRHRPPYHGRTCRPWPASTNPTVPEGSKPGPRHMNRSACQQSART